MKISPSLRKFLAATTLATGSLVSSGCSTPKLPPIEDGTVLKSPDEKQAEEGSDQKLDNLHDDLITTNIVIAIILLSGGISVACPFIEGLNELKKDYENSKKKEDKD